MSLTATLVAKISADLTNPQDLSTPMDSLLESIILAFTNGTGANQANMLWHDQRTITASATDSLDLAGGLTNAFGAVQTFARVKGILIKAAAANANDVHIAVPATNGFITWAGAAGDLVKVQPGGLFLLAAPGATGYAVTGGTGDMLDIINGGGGSSVIYDIVLIGANA